MAAVTELATTVGTARLARRWLLPRASYYRKIHARFCSASAISRRPSPARALAPAERETVLAPACTKNVFRIALQPLFMRRCSMKERISARSAPCIACSNEHGESHERRDQLTHPPYQKPELLATAPNQLWSWDITKLLRPRQVDLLLSLRNPRCVQPLRYRLDGCDRESAELAKRLIEESCAKQHIPPGQLTLHADRGTSMSSKPVAFLLADLGVTKTHSRPHVSDDNPFSESQFRTLKYRPEFPDRFGCIQDSRAFCQGFFRWYNEEHRHSGLGLLTPAMVHYGQTAAHPANSAKPCSMSPIAFIPSASSARPPNQRLFPPRYGSTSRSTQMKNSLNSMSTCLKLVDTRRWAHPDVEAFLHWRLSLHIFRATTWHVPAGKRAWR